MPTEVKLPEEWAEIDSTHVHDPDGWRQSFILDGISYPAQNWDVPITRQEWEARVSISTITRNWRKQ